MEKWPDVLSSFPTNPGHKDFGKALLDADAVLSEDLAPFEVEWLMQTLLFKPVNIFTTLSSKSTDELWSKALTDCFKVLVKLIDKYGDLMACHSSDIVQLSQQHYIDTYTRKEALHCLMSLVKSPSAHIPQEVVRRQVQGLEEATSMKAPLAYIVGAICRHRPEAVGEEYTRIWRIYLNMLQARNKTMNVTSAILHGLDGLFLHFGLDLPLDQLSLFYDSLSREYLANCTEASLSILNHHANLFKERLVADLGLRNYLWNVNSKNIVETLYNVYLAVLEEIEQHAVENIIKQEIEPRITSPIPSVKNSAAKIMIYAKTMKNISTPVSHCTLELEYQLMSRKLTYEEADSVYWGIESTVGYKDGQSLLLSAIKYYDNLPTYRRTDIVANGLFKADPQVRKAGLIVLIKLCLQEDYLQQYIGLWRVLLDNIRGKNIQKSVIIFNEAVLYLMDVMFEDVSKDISRSKSVMSLLSLLLSLHAQEMSSVEFCAVLRCALLHVSNTIGHSGSVWDLCCDQQNMNVERFQDNNVLSELMSQLKGEDEQDNTLNTLQVILFKPEADVKVLYQGVLMMDQLLKNDLNNNNFKTLRIASLTDRIKSLKARESVANKDERILQREITLFLSKYGQLATKENFIEDVYMLKLRNKITLNLESDGVTYKVDLQRILQICLRSGDMESFYSLLVLLTANLGSNLSIVEDVQDATLMVVYAIYKSQSRGASLEVDVNPALVLCNTERCVHRLMSYLTNEDDMKVKHLLSESLQLLLVSEAGGEVIHAMGERGGVMLQSNDESVVESGLFIIQAFIPTLKQNDDLTKKMLSKIITLISTVNNEKAIEIFHNITDLYIDKIDIFNQSEINDLIINLINQLCVKKYENKISNCIQHSMEFIKKICDRYKYENSDVFKKILDNLKENVANCNLINILAVYKTVFGNDASCTMEFDDFDIVIKTIDTMKTDENNDIFTFNSILLFLYEYVDALLDYNTEIVFNNIAKIITEISTKAILALKQPLSNCITIYKNKSNEKHSLLKQAFENWCEKQNIATITKHLSENTKFSHEISQLILSLKFMCDIFQCEVDNCEIWTDLIKNIPENDLKIARVFFCDILSVSERCLSQNNFENIVRNNCTFVKIFINVYFKRLILCDKELMNIEILMEMLEYFSKNYEEKYLEKIVEVIENVWQLYHTGSTTDEKITVVAKILSLPTIFDTEPAKWAMAMLMSEENLACKMKLIRVLPAGQEFCVYYKNIASLLPTRLSELRGDFAQTFKALLDSLASNVDLALFDIVITFAGGDETKGWWDYAMDECMASLAVRQDPKILDLAYQRCTTSLSLKLFQRVLLPLLRHSSSKFCESYIIGLIPGLLEPFRKGLLVANNSDVYRKQLVCYARIFTVLQIAFEKLSQKSLESGAINPKLGSDKTWYFTEEVVKHCVNLMAKVQCPAEPTDVIRHAYLWFASAAYNCLATALYRRRPKKKLYTYVLNESSWSKIVDTHIVHEFPLRAYSERKKQMNTEDSTQSSSSPSLTKTSSLTRTKTRIFLKTLSEDPLAFDMIPQQENTDEDQEEPLPDLEDSVLNTFGCLASISNLLSHLSSQDHTEWKTLISSAITGNMPENAKWLLAQAICNTKETLQAHAASLQPALLQLVASTPRRTYGRLVLHNLHMDILDTIILWKQPLSSSNPHLNTTIEYLIATCIQYQSKYTINRRIMNTMGKLAELYGRFVKVKWDVFVAGSQASSSSDQHSMFKRANMFECLLKNGVNIPELLPDVYRKLDVKHWTGHYKVSEIFGLALKQADSITRDEFIDKFRTILKQVRSQNSADYIKILYYAQKHCWMCCDVQQIRIVTDLAQKIEKAKCLSILSVHLENCTRSDSSCIEILETIPFLELLEGDLRIEAMKLARNSLKFMQDDIKTAILKAVRLNCRSSSVAVRKEAFAFILKAFQELITPPNHHAFKRKAVDSSLILNTLQTRNEYEQMILTTLSSGLFEGGDGGVSDMLMEGVGGSLDQDFSVRFAELLYLMTTLPAIEESEFSTYGYKILQLLFKQLKSEENFNNSRLRDEPLPLSVVQEIETRTMTYGLFGTTRVQYTHTDKRAIDVQLPIVTLLDSFVQLSKTNSQVCQELCLQIMRCLKGGGRRFDFDAYMVRLLGDVLEKRPSCLTAFALEACRMFVDRNESVERFKPCLDNLKRSVFGCEGALYVNLVYEDIMLKSNGRELFEFSFNHYREDDAIMSEDFSIQQLTEAFGSTCQWEDKSVQQKRCVEHSLPVLWTHSEEFNSCLRAYCDDIGLIDSNPSTYWLHKMAESVVSDQTHRDVGWLKQATQWPARPFANSAILEAIQRQNTEGADVVVLTTDCVVEWSTRLMIRSLYISEDTNMSSSCEEVIDGAHSRAAERAWCVEANRRELPNIVLQCVDRNKLSLSEDEILPWLHEKVLAHRILGLRNDDQPALKKALAIAEEQMSLLADKSSAETNVAMQTLILQLNRDLKSLSINKLDIAMNEIFHHTSDMMNGQRVSLRNQRTLKTAYNMCLEFYYKLTDEEDLSPTEVINKLINTITEIIDHNIVYDHNLLFSVLLNKLSAFNNKLDDFTAQVLVEKLLLVKTHLDMFTIDKLENIKHVFPDNIYEQLNIKDVQPSDECQRLFQTICDPNHSLLLYCYHLKKSKDDAEWREVYNRMINKFVNNHHGGTDYATLNTVRNKLITLQGKDSSTSMLDSVIKELASKQVRKTLRLNQLCPYLCDASVLETQRDSLRHLLCLPPSVYVVKFVNQVSVFTDSIRRPCVVSAILSDGHTKRFLCKSGEPLLFDASVQRCMKILPLLCEKASVRAYNVIPTGEDSAIMEFLEDHPRARDLIKEKYDIDGLLQQCERVDDDKLISSPSRALEQFMNIIKNIDPLLLRSAVQDKCACAQEFITKKKSFVDTLSTMTVICWLFGIGDRHLENILISSRDGCVCAVDMCTQNGSRDIVPARLTHNFLAVCDMTVLESRLQCLMSCLRDSAMFYEAYIKIAYDWNRHHFDQMEYIESILNGKATSVDITKEIIRKSNTCNMDAYSQLLDQVCENVPTRHTYNVEEQVSCLLLHCTSPRLLAVVPKTWEPWL